MTGMGIPKTHNRIPRISVPPHGWAGRGFLPAIGDQLAYLNSGSAFSDSLVAPGSTICLLLICNALNGTTT